MKYLALVLLLAACAPVPAYQRGRLLGRAMQGNAAVDDRYDSHVQQTRESALGATAVDGASCGCN